MKLIQNGLNDPIPTVWIWRFLIAKVVGNFNWDDNGKIVSNTWSIGYYPDYETPTFEFDFFFAWYDLWIGAFYNQKDKTLFICPLPCVVFKFYL